MEHEIALAEAMLAPGERRPPPRPNPSAGTPPPGQPADLKRLLALPHGDFLVEAYRVILGRLPDADGIRHHEDALARGATTRVAVLGALRYSEEGRARATPVPDLRRRWMLQRAYRLPLIGRLLRIVTALAAVPTMMRDMQALHERLQTADRALAGIEADVARLDERARDGVVARRTVERLVRETVATETALRDRLDAVAGLAARSASADALASLAARVASVEAARDGAARRRAALAPLHVALAARFRGTRDDIRDRARFYLSPLREAGAGTAARPVLDLGSGRGELLALLRDEGLVGRGVDANPAMAADAIADGLAIAIADGVDHLAAQPAGSLGAVTAIHVAEHLAFERLVALLDAAHRALAPGGLLALETPNPANLMTASRFFHLDPTHVAPLPGELLAALASLRGFDAVSIVPLHPDPWRFPAERDPALADALDDVLHGARDYALLARRPG